jgi:hypothetical protein
MSLGAWLCESCDFFSLASLKGGEGWGEEAKISFEIKSPHPPCSLSLLPVLAGRGRRPRFVSLLARQS